MKISHIALGALALLGLAACGGSDSTGPAPAAAIQLTNQANAAIVDVYISSCSDDEWGADRLGAAESIAPGASRAWTMPAGCYDVKASTDAKSGFWYDRTLVQGDTLSLALSPNANSSVARAGKR